MGTGPLAGLRIGSLSFLNGRPLIWGIDPASLHLDVPARLADLFQEGRLDAAMLPIYEIFRLCPPHVVDDAAIACRGAVFSVHVAARGPLEECEAIQLDPASRSSISLLRILLDEFLRRPIPLVDSGGPETARLLIGDRAIAFRRAAPEGWQFHDLGELWQRYTGLPFVFAMWALRSGLDDPAAVAAELRRRKEEGLAAKDQIAAREPDPAFVRHYLGGSIRFGIGPEEKQAIALFQSLARKHGLLAAPCELNYI